MKMRYLKFKLWTQDVKKIENVLPQREVVFLAGMPGLREDLIPQKHPPPGILRSVPV